METKVSGPEESKLSFVDAHSSRQNNLSHRPIITTTTKCDVHLDGKALGAVAISSCLHIHSLVLGLSSHYYGIEFFSEGYLKDIKQGICHGNMISFLKLSHWSVII